MIGSTSRKKALNTYMELFMVMSLEAVLQLFLSHIKHRISKETINASALEKAADDLRRMAWNVERNQTQEDTSCHLENV